MVALLPLFGLVTYTSLQSQQASLAGTRDNLLATARLTALRHERSVEGARQILGAIASAPEVKNQVLPQCTGFLKSLHDKYPFYTNLGLLDLDGNLVCHAVNINGARFLGDRYYFKQALAKKSFVIGEYIIGRTSGRPSITFAVPVADDKGATRGVAFVALDVDKLVGDQHITAPSSVAVTITDRNGTLLGASASLSERTDTQAMDPALFATVKALPTHTFEARDQNGMTNIYAAAAVGSGAWPGLFVTASIPREAVLTPAKKQLALALALLAMFVTIGVVGARWVANRTIVEPTRRLLRQVNAMAGGGGTEQSEGAARAQNELAGLTSAFNRMAAILQAREEERDKAEQLLTIRLHQHEAIAQLSVEVARAALLENVFQSATQRVADALAIDLCKVLQLTPDQRHFLLLAGVGWKPGLVATALVDADAHSQAGYTLRADEPVFVEDLRTESRFETPPLLAAHDVVSGISVAIHVQGRPWGVLGAHSRTPRSFTRDDTHFMQSVANLIALAIERMSVQVALVEHSRSMNEAQGLAQLGSWEFDIASQAMTWSDEMIRISGRDPAGLPGGLDDYLKLVHPEDREPVQAGIAATRQSLVPFDSQHRIIRPDGSIRHVRARGEFRRDHNGQSIAVGGTVLDVTDLRAAQVRAEEVAELLAEAQHVASMGSWELNVVTGQLYWPPQTCRLFGIVPEAFGGTFESALQFVIPEDRQMVIDAHQSGTTVTGVTEVEFRISRADDDAVRWIRKRGVLKCNALGQEVRRLGMVMDITDSKLAEQHRLDLLALEQSARREADAASHYYRSLFESAPGCYLVLTPHDYRIVAVSDAYLEATMTTRAQLSGQYLFDVFPDDPAEPDADGVEQLRASLERVRYSGLGDVMAVQRFPIRRPEAGGDGFEERFWSTVNSPVAGPDGRLAYIIHRVEDVTAYLRVKGQGGESAEARQTLESRSQLIEADIVLRSQELGRARQALAQSQALLGMASRLSRVGAWALELPSQKLTLSEEARAIQEMPPDYTPTLAQAISFYAPEYMQAIQNAFVACTTMGRGFDGEFQLITAQGKRIWVRAMGEAVRDADGAIVRVQGALQDISAQKDAELRERGLSSRLTATLESISDGFYLIDKDWNFAYLNGQAERMLHRSRHDLLGKNTWQEFPAAVGSSIEHEYRRAVQTHCTGRFEVFFPPLDTWFDVHAYPTDEGLAVYFRDITQWRLAQTQLRLLETAVSRLNDIVVITEASPINVPGPRIVFVNDAFERMTGYSRDEVLGQSPRLLQGPETQRAELDRIRAALEQSLPVRAELINYTKTGQQFWIEIDVVPIVDEKQGFTHFVAVQRDITDRKLAEKEILELNASLEDRVRERTLQLEAVNRELEAFSYSVSHDLRSPLNTIGGFGQLLQKSNHQLDDKGRHYLNRIRAGAQHMGELIEGLLSLAKMNRDPLRVQRVDLSALTARVVQECRESEPRREVEVRVQDSVWTHGDPALLHVVMQNLVGNAWKYTSRQPLATIDVGSETASGGETVYFVRDNGAGFDMASVDKLFEAFQRLHSSSEFEGIGIGLANVKRVVVRHGGRVWAESRPNEGAAFYFTLRAREVKSAT